MQVRTLNAGDATAYQNLRLRALRESPTAFSASWADEADRSIADIAARLTPAADGSACTLAAIIDNELVGYVAFIRPMRAKLAHRAELAGMYVAPEHRRGGVARALLSFVVAHAREHGLRQLKVGVNRSNLAACELYRSAGFVVFGTEPDALFIDGVYYDEEHSVLRLR